MSDVSQRETRRGGLVLLCLFLFCVVCGPVIFYGLVVMGRAGMLDFLAERVWLVAPLFVVIIGGWSLAVLAIGNRLSRPANHRESSNG